MAIAMSASPLNVYCGWSGLRAGSQLFYNAASSCARWTKQFSIVRRINAQKFSKNNCRKHRALRADLLPVDPWSPSVNSQSIASALFATSLIPYLGFLYSITKSRTAPPLTLFGFYFLLAFVGATTKVHYGTSLSNVDWLHGGAESLLTITNLLIVFGLRGALRDAKEGEDKQDTFGAEVKEEENASSPK